MLAITQFSIQDSNTIKGNKKSVNAYLMIFLKLFAPLSFLLGFIGLAKKGFGYWPTTFGFLLFFSFIVIYLIIKESILFNKDLKNQLKYKGTMKVLKKSRSRNDCLIYTDSKRIKET